MQGCLAVITVLAPIAMAYPSALPGLHSSLSESNQYQQFTGFDRMRRTPFHYPGFYFSLLKPNAYDQQVKRDATPDSSMLQDFGLAGMDPGANREDYEAKKKLWEMFNIYNRYS